MWGVPGRIIGAGIGGESGSGVEAAAEGGGPFCGVDVGKSMVNKPAACRILGTVY